MLVDAGLPLYGILNTSLHVSGSEKERSMKNSDSRDIQPAAQAASAQMASPAAAESPAGFRVAVNAIIEREGMVLLARRRDIGWWNLPGGGVELYETVDEGLRRVVHEEIGVEVEIDRLVGVYSKPQKHEVVLTFLCHLSPEQERRLQTTEEVSEVCWFLPSELPQDLLPKHRQRVEDAFRGQTAAILRAQRSSTEEDQGLSNM